MLKVMTFNLRGSMFEIDGANYWPHRVDLNIRTIKAYDPDIIGFQEYQSGHLADYDKHLPEYAYELGLMTIDDSEFGMQNPVYWRKTRFKLEDAGQFYLSETPAVWSLGWDSVLVRAATWVRLHDLIHGQSVFVLNTHLDHLGEAARVNGARLVVEKVDTLRDGLPTLVMADFNSRVWAMEDHGGTFPPGMEEEATPAGTVYAVFAQAGYTDTYRAAGLQEGIDTNTYHGFEGENYPQIGQRIDWILTLDGGAQYIKTRDCAIIRDGEPPLYPSDHYPVLATVEIVP